MPPLRYTSTAIALHWIMAFLQYLAPTIAFLIGVLVYHETLDTQRMLSLAAIWAGLAVYSVDISRAAKHARMSIPA